MTENKRFIRIVDHLEKEVRIYDTINEKKIFNIFFNELDSAICLNGALTDTVDLLNDLSEENEQLKDALNQRTEQCDKYYDENEQLKQQINKLEAQLHCPFDSICIKCNNEYLVQKGEYYVSRCKKGHEQCSKIYVRYCDDFELKGDD